MDLIFCFDIDGTLLSTSGAGTRSFKRAIQSLFNTEPDWSSISMAGRVDTGIFKDILNSIGEYYSFDLWNKFKSLYINYLEEEIYRSDFIVFDGVFDFLKKLDKYDKILLTGNIREGARIKLDFKNLSVFFDWERSVFGDEAEYLRDELSVSFKNKNPNKIPVIIGDTPLDIKLAKLVGGLSIGVTTGIHSESELSSCYPDFIVKRLDEIDISEVVEKTYLKL